MHDRRQRADVAMIAADRSGRRLTFAGVIDLHCHVLPGIDDGPESIEGSLALARAAVAAGTRTLVATPHVSRRYPNDPDTIARLVRELNARLVAERIPLEVLPGAEVALSRLLDIAPEQLRRLGLGASGWLLVEPPFTVHVSGLDSIILDLQGRGHRIVLAHPERCPAFHRDRAMLESLLRAGVLSSLTAGSLVGSFGADVRRFALGLVRDGLVDNVSSDAHDHIRRPPQIADELKRAGLDPLADWLTRQVPAAILRDADAIPPRPRVDLSAGSVTDRMARWWRRRG